MRLSGDVRGRAVVGQQRRNISLHVLPGVWCNDTWLTGGGGQGRGSATSKKFARGSPGMRRGAIGSRIRRGAG